MRVVVDTNAWVSGLILPDSVPGKVIDAVRMGVIPVVASWDLAEEIADVLRRPKLRRYQISEDDVRDVLLLLAPLLPSVETDVEVRDPEDAPVISAAIAGKVDAIVSGDSDLLEDPGLRGWLRVRGVEVLTPSELLARLGSSG